MGGAAACFAAGAYPFLPLIKEWSLTIGTIVELALLIGLTGFVFVRMILERFPVALIASFLLLMLFLTAYCFLGGFGVEALSGFRALALPLIVYLAFYKGEVASDKRVGLAARVTIAAALIMSVGCIVQFVYPEAIKQLHNPENWIVLRSKTDWIPFSQYNRAMSFMNDPNVLSVFLCIALFMHLELISLKDGTSKKDHAISGLLFLGVVLTGSRTGVVLIGAYLILKLPTLLSKAAFSPKKVIVVSAFLLLGMIALAVLFDEVISYLRIDTLLTGNGRFTRNSFIFEALGEKDSMFLFGHGLFDGRSITFENSYLLLFYMFGLVGLVMYGALLLVLFRPLLGGFNAAPLLCCAAAFFVGDYVVIPQVSLYIVLWLLLGRSLNSSCSQIRGNVI